MNPLEPLRLSVTGFCHPGVTMSWRASVIHDSDKPQHRTQFICRMPVATLIMGLFLLQSAAALSPGNLKTEYVDNPIGLDVLHPRLSWILSADGRAQKQTAYQVQVADSAETLASGHGVAWDSGKVDSDRNFGIVYGGPDLQSGSRHYWHVRVWDQDGRPSDWSHTAWWEMGLLSPSDWTAKWIGTTDEIDSPLLRKEFRINGTVQKATAYVYAFGFYELHLNGAKVGDSVLAPVNSNYTKIYYYDTYDITSFVKPGGNALGLWLANGYDRNYNSYGYRWMTAKQALLQVEIVFADGSHLTVVTDETWKASQSPILSASIYNGETYDARRQKTGWDEFGYGERDWKPVRLFAAPNAAMHSRLMPPVKVCGEIHPIAMHQPKPGVYVFDMGQDFAGWTRVHARGPAGTTIVMRHAEELLPDGTLNTVINRAARATDTFILKGSGVEVYEPRFTYHGYRYVEVTGYSGTPALASLEGRVVHAAVEPAGEFHSSDALLNHIQRNFEWGLKNNLMGIPTDNPTRSERTPCLMDSMIAEGAAIYNFDMNNFYAKWLADIQGGRDDPNWSGDEILLPMLLYEYYGNARAIEENYENSKQLLEAFAAQAARPHAWSDSFGDWCPPMQSGYYKDCFSEGAIVNTSVYYRATLLVAQMAEILGRKSDAETYRARAQSILSDFNSHFYKPSTHTYGSGVQVTSVMPLAFDMTPPGERAAVARALFERLTGEDRDHLDTGIFGTRYLFDVLMDNGYADAAFTTLTQTTYPSYGDQIRMGATTTWEQWHYLGGMETHDHAMYAGAGSTFYSRLAGIQPAEPGYRRILIRPVFPKGPNGLTWVKCSLQTVMGKVVSNWSTQDGLIQEITIPPDASAEVYVPAERAEQVEESGMPAMKAAGVNFLRMENGEAVFSVASGSYRFTVRGK